jgi:tRNA pseudouridine13 synthase
MLDARVNPSTYLSAGIPGIGGRIKAHPEDFLVEEVPLYEPSGSGEHLMMFVEKRGLSTMHMVRVIARHFGVSSDAVGVAGLKDRQAITRQHLTVHVPGKKPTDFPEFTHDAIRIEWIDMHTNKLRRGHLAANRFIIRVRDVEPSKVVHALKTLQLLASRGVPNRFGPQRFGFLENNHLVGRHLLRGEWHEALVSLLGPSESHPTMQVEQRQLYAEGKFAEAAARYPASNRVERRALEALARGWSEQSAVARIDRMQLGFLVTAFQSALFNRVLDERLAEVEGGRALAELREGDLATKHQNLAVFQVTPEVAIDPETRRRLDALEISPSGPMWGPGMMRASGATGELEARVLAESGVDESQLELFAKKYADMVEGLRRPLRVPLMAPDIEGGVDAHGAYIKCRFELPRGAFATEVMREVMKPSDIEESGVTEDAE